MASQLPASDHFIDTKFFLSVLGTFQDVADILKANEKDIRVKIFLVDLKTRCLMLQEHYELIADGAHELDGKLLNRVVRHLESLTKAPGESYLARNVTVIGSTLSVFRRCWEDARLQDDKNTMLELAQV
ncbi:hypothetical protein K456DRAFT_1729054 [Colletotrichum gloeosporioides 23]|nr:hypothetical protein K456DRAFT_1729054 [Colletotrichum gloeosporioides 23]